MSGPYRTAPAKYIPKWWATWWVDHRHTVYLVVVLCSVGGAIFGSVMCGRDERAAAWAATCRKVCATHEGGSVFRRGRSLCSCLVPGDGVVTYNRRLERSHADD
jgi:hypothetical protein